MKPGTHYALAVLLVAALAIILVQQRKLSNARNSNAQLQGSSRALNVTLQSNDAVNVGLQQELRKVRGENEDLRREIQQLRTAASNTVTVPR